MQLEIIKAIREDIEELAQIQCSMVRNACVQRLETIEVIRWKAMANLSNSIFLSEIKNRLRENEQLSTSVLATIYQACSYACERSKLILKTMPEYTLHDETHLTNVLTWMERLVPEDLLHHLSVPELMLMVLSAYMHDLGMAPSEEEFAVLRGEVDEQSLTADQKDDLISYSTNKDVILSKGGTDQYAMVVFIRNTHAKRIRRILGIEYSGDIKYAGFDLKSVLADICVSHNEDIGAITGSPVYLLGGYPVCITFLKVMLRLADILDFDCDRAPEILFRILSIQNEVSRREWEKHRSIQNISIEGNILCISAVCEKPTIEYAIRSFAKVIEDELIRCRAVLMSIHDPNVQVDKYKEAIIPISVDCSRVNAGVDPVTGRSLYQYFDLRFNLNKDKIITLLMGDALYGGDEVELRELLQNALDTTMLRKKISDVRGVEYTPRVIVSYNSKDHSLSVEDNGMGMDVEDLQKYYSTIGTSYYKSSDYKSLVSKYSVSYHPISRFGIGVLSCFMASNTIEFETRKFIPFSTSKEPIHVTIEGKDEIFYIVDGTRELPGTKTTLRILPGRELYSVGEAAFGDLVRNTILCPPFDIDVLYDGFKHIHSGNALMNIDLDSCFKGNHWESIDGCYPYEMIIDDITQGIKGKIRMLLIEQNGMPVKSIDYPSKSVTVDGVPYEVCRDLHYGVNVLLEGSSELSFDDERVGLHQVGYWKCHSMGIIALHGMTVHHNLFPDNSIEVGATMRWPFPLQLVLNCGEYCDLDIDSSRGKIIAGEKWDTFERRLAFIIFCNLFKSKGLGYAKRFREVSHYLQQLKHNRFSNLLFLGIDDAFISCFGCNL